MLRTFSKAHGLAGIRVGYCFGPAELLREMSRLQTTYSVSGVAQAAALAALDDEVHVKRAVENNALQANFIKHKIEELELRAVETWANFVYFEVGEEASVVTERLQREGIFVRPLGAWGAPNGIRVTIGTPEQNQLFARALQKVLDRTPSRQ